MWLGAESHDEVWTHDLGKFHLADSNCFTNTVTNMGNTFRTQTQRLQREIRATELQFNRATRLLNQEKAKSQALRQLLTNNGIAIPANLRR